MRKVEKFPQSRAGPKKYEFENMEIGEPYLFERGVDYKCKDDSFVCIAKEWARRQHKKMLARKVDEGVVLMVLNKELCDIKSSSKEEKP